jgi:hypothetical protein
MLDCKCLFELGLVQSAAPAMRLVLLDASFKGRIPHLRALEGLLGAVWQDAALHAVEPYHCHCWAPKARRAYQCWSHYMKQVHMRTQCLKRRRRYVVIVCLWP